MVATTATAVAKARRRLIPFLFLLYVVSYLDRINVGFAALQMKAALGFSNVTYSLGDGIFFLSYTLFEVPSNLILARVGARLWIARIMITWGMVSAGMMFARTPTHFYVLRFLLGAAYTRFYMRPSWLANYFGIGSSRVRHYVNKLDDQVSARHARQEIAAMSRAVVC